MQRILLQAAEEKKTIPESPVEKETNQTNTIHPRNYDCMQRQWIIIQYTLDIAFVISAHPVFTVESHANVVTWSRPLPMREKNICL